MTHGMLFSVWRFQTVSVRSKCCHFSNSHMVDPTTQADFRDQVVDNVTDIDPGHQCYKIGVLEGITAGSPGTIQLEYWAEFEGENNGNNQSFFACADIVRIREPAVVSETYADMLQTFVETTDFDLQVPCFNVTSDDFAAPTPSSAATALPSDVGPSASTSPSDEQSSGDSGLSGGTKAGIAVGAVIGGLALFGAIGFFLWRRRQSAGLKRTDEYELRTKNLTT